MSLMWSQPHFPRMKSHEIRSPGSCDAWFLLPQVFWSFVFCSALGIHEERKPQKYRGGGSKMMVPNNHWFSGFPTKNDHFGGVLGLPPFFMGNLHKLYTKILFHAHFEKTLSQETRKTPTIFRKMPGFPNASDTARTLYKHCWDEVWQPGCFHFQNPKSSQTFERCFLVVWWCLNLRENVTIKLTI